jgi:DNA-binding LacI/PurR family transcriptional regulator
MTPQDTFNGKQVLYHSISDQIFSDIRQGQYPLGAKLPSQAECVAKYGVSVTTVRQAMGNLERRGVIRREQGRGAFVSLHSNHRTSQRLVSLGLLIEESGRASDKPAEDQVLLAMRRCCSAESLRLSVVETRFDVSQGGLAMIEACQGLQVDGFCLCPHAVEAEQMQRLLDVLPAAVALASGIVDELQPIDLIDMDLQPGAAELLHHAVSLGHDRIAYVGAYTQRCLAGDPVATRGRWQEYHRHMTRKGQAIDTDLVIASPETDQPDTPFANKLLAAVTGESPASLIMAENDWIARQCIQVLYRSNLRIPDDVSVIGFDDQPFASQLVPALSTVALPLDAACRAAIAMLRQRLASPAAGPRHTRLNTTMKLRQSLAKPKES